MYCNPALQRIVAAFKEIYSARRFSYIIPIEKASNLIVELLCYFLNLFLDKFYWYRHILNLMIDKLINVKGYVLTPAKNKQEGICKTIAFQSQYSLLGCGDSANINAWKDAFRESRSSLRTSLLQRLYSLFALSDRTLSEV